MVNALLCYSTKNWSNSNWMVSDAKYSDAKIRKICSIINWPYMWTLRQSEISWWSKCWICSHFVVRLKLNINTFKVGLVKRNVSLTSCCQKDLDFEKFEPVVHWQRWIRSSFMEILFRLIFKNFNSWILALEIEWNVF